MVLVGYGLSLLLGLQMTQPTEVFVVRDSVRLDLKTSVALDSKRVGTPKEKDAIILSATPIRLRGIRDEVLSFQLIVTGEPGPRFIRPYHFTDSSGGQLPVRMSFFEQRGINVREESLNHRIRSLGEGFYPDALIPTSTVVVRPKPKVTAVWVDVWIRPECPSGTFQGAFSVGAASNKIEIELEVVDATMPKRSVAGLGAVNFGSVLERQNRVPDKFLQWMHLAQAHHFNIEFLRSRPRKDSNGFIEWDLWAEKLDPLFTGAAFTAEYGYDGPRAGLPVTRFVLPHTDWWPARETDAKLPSDPKAWSLALKRWERLAIRRGWLEQEYATDFIVFINSLDEPKSPEAFEALKAYQALIEDARLEERKHIRFRMDGGFGGDVADWPDAKIVKELGPLVDDWNLCGAVEWMPLRPLARQILREDTDRLFFYASNTSGEPTTPPVVIDAPLLGLRAWGWIVYRNGLAGALNWEVDYRPGCVRNPQCSEDLLNLDANLIYRGEEFGLQSDTPVASIRLKTLRRGAQDVALLSLLAKKEPQVAAKIAARILPKTFRDIDKDEKYGLWPVSDHAYEQARTAILDRLSGISEPLSVESIPISTAPVSVLREQAGKWSIALGVVLIVFAYQRTRRRIREMKDV